MKMYQRGMFAFLLLWLALMPILAQDNASNEEAAQAPEVTALGSNLALPLLTELHTLAGSPTTLTVEGVGSSSSFAQFCQNNTPLIATSRRINDTEKAACDAAGVAYTELPLAHHIAVVIINPQDTFLSCLTISTLNTLFAPSATADNWQTIQEGFPDEPLAVIVPPSDDWVNVLFDNTIQGVGLRTRASILDEDSLVTQVAENSGTIGVTSASKALANIGSVAPLPVDFENGNGCVVATAEAVEAGAYPLATTYYLYVNNAQKEVLGDLLAAVVNPENAAQLQALGYTPLSFGQYQRNVNILTNETAEEGALAQQATYVIPNVLSGEVTIGGSPALKTSLDTVTQLLTATRTDLRYTTRLLGEVNGARRFCNGELDILVTTQELDEATQAACAANEVVPYSETVGKKAVVLLANAQDSFNICLTTEQAQTLWRASETPINTWNALSNSFPELPITLFGISAGSEVSDLLLARANEPVAPVRQDTELNADPLYRAAATANVQGAITYMTWEEYQRVLANNQQNVQLVALNNGSGCVQPSEATIQDSTYPLTQTVMLVADQASLVNDAVRALLWLFFEDSNRNNLQNAGFVGITNEQLLATRTRLITAFAEAEALAAAAQATPEASDAEATPEATQAP